MPEGIAPRSGLAGEHERVGVDVDRLRCGCSGFGCGAGLGSAMTRPLPPLIYRGLRYPRTSDAAFQTPAYAQGWEPHIPPPLLQRFVLFLKRRFA